MTRKIIIFFNDNINDNLNRIILFIDNLDPLVKREIKYIFIGTVSGYVIGKILTIIMNKIQANNLADKTIGPKISKPNGKRRRILKLLRKLRGGEIVSSLLFFMATTNTLVEFLTAVGSLSGFGLFLTSMNRKELYKLIKGASTLRPQELALMPLTSGMALDEIIRDLTCTKGLELLREVLVNRDLPAEEKKELMARYIQNALKKTSLTDKLLFILCLLRILLSLYPQHFQAFILFLEKLRQLFLSGKISRSSYYLLLRKAARKGMPVESYIQELASREIN